MRLKTYVVGNMTEAIPLIKRDLGADAMILNTKKVKTGGFLGFFQKEKLEVTAAIDPGATKEKERVPTEFPNVQAIKQPPVQKETATELISELKNIKQFMMQQMTEERLPEAFQLVKTHLTAQGVAEDIQLELIAKIISKSDDQTDDTLEKLWSATREEIIALIDKKQPPIAAQEPGIICFIGPTGVGKTTTIAKIAADYMLTKDKKVGLITADTYRIAAVEQLKTYGSILNLPVRVVDSASELKQAIGDFADCDIILMDTAGRNYQQKQYIEELERLLPDDNKVQINLVLSLTAKYEDMKKIIDNFQSIAMDELLLTKKDETSSSGAILNLISQYDIPIRYIADGQNVPDDILTVTSKLVADFIMGEENHA